MDRPKAIILCMKYLSIENTTVLTRSRFAATVYNKMDGQLPNFVHWYFYVYIYIFSMCIYLTII